MKKKVVFILGPTGSGKTALAVKLAKKFNGEIISADSRQVYIGLDVGSGKDLEEYDDIKYHLIDIAMPEENLTLFGWLKSARLVLDELFTSGKIPIVVGGTGLYTKALAEGYKVEKSEIRNQKSEQNPRITREKLDSMTVEQLNELTNKLNISTENLDLKNPRRLIRAIEKAQEGTVAIRNKPDFDILQFEIDIPREDLYKRIDLRVDSRFEHKQMKEEVEGLINSGVSKDWLKSLGLEYKFITEYLEGNYQFEEMKQELKWKTHAYARRQLTWLRKQPNILKISKYKEAEQLVDKFLKVI